MAEVTSGMTPGNRLTFYDDGHALFEEKKLAMRRAQERIWVETFMILPDKTGRETVELLADAASRGCDVVLMFDQVGSHIMSAGFYRPVEKAGGRVAIFNPLPLWRRYGRRRGPFVKYRNHRKTMIADDVAFCGGHNYTRSYMGEPPARYYDMTVKIEGPAVEGVSRVFMDGLKKTGHDAPPLPRPAAVPAGVDVKVLEQDQRAGQHGAVRAWTELLDSAERSVVAVMAYFSPDRTLLEPFVNAAKRGVDVRLLTVHKTDFPFVRWAAETSFSELLRAGVRIYRLKEPMLHAKALVIDDEMCMVGSFDASVFEKDNNAEVVFVARDPQLAAAIRGGFGSCMPRSEEVRLEEWVQRSRLRRLRNRLAKLVVRV